MRTIEEIDRMVRIEVSNLVLDITDRGMSYTALALELGVDARSLRRWRDGECIPSALYLEMLRELSEREGESDDLPSHFLWIRFLYLRQQVNYFCLCSIDLFSAKTDADINAYVY